MRWDQLSRDDSAGALFGTDVVTTRTFDTPEIHKGRKGTVPNTPSLPLSVATQ